ncbi:MAG: IPT/TIG domain-containing protein [Acidobacteriota bacterium]|nr:IPT/TIG domain-containing protein [Acidobacteriota bacterium]
MSWRHQAAERKEAGKMAVTSVSSASNASLISLNGRAFEQNDGAQGVIVGEFEGYFDGKTRSFTLQPKGTRSTEGKGSRLYSRSDPSGEVSQGAGFSFRVVRSALVSSADQSATVTGEIELTNNTSATLYNTRIVFNSFKVTNAAGADANNLPGANGFAYFNDGQVAYNGKLSVSRDYGDIAAAGKSTRVWSFAVANQPPSFFFAYKVIADLGVAAESVAPAAVQINASTGTSVTISGRGFTGTPTVELVAAAGAATPMTGVTATATSITATVPAGTAAGIYSVRVTNPGGTANGQGSSTIRGRLTVTGVPSNTLSGSIPGGAFASGGAYLVTGAASIGSSTPIPPGTVIYVAGGATISISGSGNINADGGVPGVSATAGQIVFTAQRSPGASVPTSGAWGGIDATAAATSSMTMRNVVVEYGGGSGLAAVNITGSGRTLRFTDGILRNSSGSGLRALGTNDSVTGFSRNRVENNGLSATDPALLLSGNAALGLYDLPTTGATVATSVGDASFYYSAANDFAGNQVNAVRIGTTADATSNDFSKSGVLVGQGATPIQIAGDCSNPAIVGAQAPAMAELTITPSANIQLAADLNLQAGDYATDRVGCIAANGYAGVYLGTQPGAPAANSLISFDKIPGGGNFGAIFFARNAMTNCILNYVSVQNGGATSSCSLGNASIISDGTNVIVSNSQISNSATGGLLATSGAKIDSRGTTSTSTTPIIDTVIGGQLGDGNPGLKVNIITPAVAAADPMDRGVYFVDSASSGNFVRFFNTTRNTVTIGGMKVAPGTIRTVVGGGLDGGENVPGRVADSGTVTGLAVSKNGEILYYVDSIVAAVRVWNASNSAKTINGANIGAGNVGTLSPTSFGNVLNGVAVHPTTGDVYVIDATPGTNKVFKIPAAGGAATDFAGNGANTARNDPLTNGAAATSVPLSQPRALTFDGAGNLYIADTGHGRVSRVDGSGSIFSVYQLDVPPPPGSWNNPHISGVAFHGGKLYAALGNQQTIVAVTNPATAAPTGAVVAGTADTACDYTSSTCGDGGTIDQAAFNLLGSTATPPLASIAADSKGIFVLDQGAAFKGRIRYMNLGANATEVAGIAIPANNINTVAGSGLASPFEGALASSADLSAPLGVAVDANGNMWLTNSTANRLQFANCGTTPVTIFAGTQAQQTVPPGTIVSVNKDVGSGPTDGAPVNTAAFDTPQGIVATAQGLFIADSRRGPTITTMSRRTGLIRFINTSASNVTFYSGGGTGIPITVPAGNIATIAGGGIGTISDGASPTGARFLGPTDIAIHPTTGDIYIADAGQQEGTSASTTGASRIRRVNRSTGAVSTILTGGANDAFVGLSFDSNGRLLVANAGRKTSAANFGNSSILREKASGQCATTPASCFDTILSGGTGSLLKNPRDVAEGKDGALYVTNAGPSELGRSDNKILRIVISGTTGTASVFAGNTLGYSGDGGPAANALLNLEATDFQTSTSGTRFDVRVNIGILVTPNGDIIFADSKNNAIRRIR